MDVLETITVSRTRHKKTVEDVAKDAGFKVKKVVKKPVVPQETDKAWSEHKTLERKLETVNNNADGGADDMASLFPH